ELLPIGTLPVAAAQVCEQAMTEFADGQIRLGNPGREQILWRAVAQEKRSVIEKGELRKSSEEFRIGERARFAVRRLELLREGEFVRFAGEMRSERKHFAAELQMAGAGEFHTRTVTPTREPLEQEIGRAHV